MFIFEIQIKTLHRNTNIELRCQFIFISIFLHNIFVPSITHNKVISKGKTQQCLKSSTVLSAINYWKAINFRVCVKFKFNRIKSYHIESYHTVSIRHRFCLLLMCMLMWSFVLKHFSINFVHDYKKCLLFLKLKIPQYPQFLILKHL